MNGEVIILYFTVHVKTGFESSVIAEIKKRLEYSAFKNYVSFHNLKRRVIRNGKKIYENILQGYIIVELKESYSQDIPPELYYILKNTKKVLNVLKTAISTEEFKHLQSKAKEGTVEVDEQPSAELLEKITEYEVAQSRLLRKKKKLNKYEKDLLFAKVREIRAKLKHWNEQLKIRLMAEKKLESFALIKGKTKVYAIPGKIINMAGITGREDSLTVLRKAALYIGNTS
jgi:transcription antitermination factor NusG